MKKNQLSIDHNKEFFIELTKNPVIINQIIRVVKSHIEKTLKLFEFF